MKKPLYAECLDGDGNVRRCQACPHSEGQPVAPRCRVTSLQVGPAARAALNQALSRGEE